MIVRFEYCDNKKNVNKQLNKEFATIHFEDEMSVIGVLSNGDIKMKRRRS